VGFVDRLRAPRRWERLLVEAAVIGGRVWNVDARHDAIEQAIQNLARRGLIVDSGRRRWSERTRSYQIVWIAREFADPDRLRKI
jgi:hypothetical protein